MNFFEFFADLGIVPTLMVDDRTPPGYRIVLFQLTLAMLPMLVVGVALLYWFVIVSSTHGATPLEEFMTNAGIGAGALFLVIAVVRMFCGQETVARREKLPESETLESHLSDLERGHIAEMQARSGR